VTRKKLTGGGASRPRQYEDHQAHADTVRHAIAAAHSERPTQHPFAVDARAILVLTLNHAVADDVWEGVDRLELDGQTLSATVAFSRRVELSTFLERLANIARRPRLRRAA
jgi:hypothetical protein